MKSEIEWVTDHQPWHGLFRDVEKSGGRPAMIVTVQGRDLRVSLRGGLVIVLQQTTEPLTTHGMLVAQRWTQNGEDQPVTQALVVALKVIMLNELTNRSPERPFTNENHLVEA